jgi:alanine racemase
VQEGVALRRAGIHAPVLLLSQQPAGQLTDVVRHSLIPTVHSAEGVHALAAAVRAGGHGPYPVHLKVDTGMHRVGCQPEDALGLARRVVATPGLQLAGLFTHLAVADEPDELFTALQLDRFESVVAALQSAGIEPPVVHAANSAGGLAHPAARLSLVRAGIAVYGLVPGPGVADFCRELRPALSLKARITLVKRVRAGEGVSYGLRYHLPRDAWLATVPLGYADGVPRRLFVTGGEVLVGGRRRPIAGVVTMDQFVVDCGEDEPIVGDEVVLIGRQADEEVTADEWANRLGTINYEVVCGLSTRLARRTTSPQSRADPDR